MITLIADGMPLNGILLVDEIPLVLECCYNLLINYHIDFTIWYFIDILTANLNL